MTYQDWTYQIVRDRVVEAVDTARTLPEGGPASRSGFWPQYVGLYASDMRVRRIPSPGALTRMEETWAWINGMLNEDSRRILYDYADVKSTKGKTIQRFCENNGWIKDTFERAVRDACQLIANELNRKQKVRLTMALDDVRQNLVHEEPDQIGHSAPKRQPLAAMTLDAKPSHDPSPEYADEFARHLAEVNKQRRLEAERRRREEEQRRSKAA